MPRQQQPPDPDQGPTAAFAQKLYALRQAVGSPSYREMGERANICHTSLSRAAKGDRFPTWGTTKAFVLACDADVKLWRWRWEVASRGRGGTEAPERVHRATPPGPQPDIRS